MRNRSLHQVLRDYAEQAAFQLEADAGRGAEIPFEVVESPGAHAALYCYRPLTGEFIRERGVALGRLPTYARAARALEVLGGLDVYLRARGEPRVPNSTGERVDAVLRVFVSRMFEDATEFEFTHDRFTRAYSEFESAVYESRSLTSVIAPLHGLELVSEEVQLADGLTLVRGDALADAPAEAVWGGPGGGEAPNALVQVDLEDDSDPLETALLRLGRLLTAMRLVDAAGFAFGPAAWMRVQAGAWQLVPMPIGRGRARGEPYRIEPDQEDELRGFCNLITRRAPGAGAGDGALQRGEVAWALRRFELGCERDDRYDGLTDHLLGLRALLEPEGPASGRLAQRLAAICAQPDQRAALAERAAHAISLERALVAGVEPVDADARLLIEDVGHHLRALLRDVLCGHLDAHLVAVADDLLSEAATGESAVVPEQQTASLAL